MDVTYARHVKPDDPGNPKTRPNPVRIGYVEISLSNMQGKHNTENGLVDEGL